jgi:hypothetical protein
MSLRVALRSLARTRGFTAAAVLTLALGIGLATAVYTVAHALLLRDLPVREQDRVAVLWGERRDGSFAHFPFTLEDARAFARGSRAVRRAAFAAYEARAPAAVLDGRRITRLQRAYVSGDFFAVPAPARCSAARCAPEDDVVWRGAVVVLSHAAWQRHTAATRARVGARSSCTPTAWRTRWWGDAAGARLAARHRVLGALGAKAVRRDRLGVRARDVVARLAPGASAEPRATR